MPSVPDLLDTIDLAALAGWAYLAIFAICIVDSMFPVLPAETLVITGGVLAAGGEMHLPAVVALAVAGTFVGDLIVHSMGRRSTTRLRRRWLHKERERRAMVAAARAVDRHGTTMVVVGRFVPLGRTSVALVTGVVRFPLRSYLSALAIGCTLWSVESVGTGYLVGHLVDDLWMSVPLGLAIGAGLTGVGLLVRRLMPTPPRPEGERAPVLEQLSRAGTDQVLLRDGVSS